MATKQDRNFVPIREISDILKNFHSRKFDRYLKTPGWLDFPLRRLKDPLMSFLIFAVFYQMSLKDIYLFIYRPYTGFQKLKC